MEGQLKQATTSELVEELKTRLGVQHLFTEPYKEIEIYVNKERQNLEITQGPVNILIVWD